MPCAVDSDEFEAGLFIRWTFGCLQRGRHCPECWVYCSEPTKLHVFLMTRAAAVPAFMREPVRHQHICPLVRGQQAGFSVVTAAAGPKALSRVLAALGFRVRGGRAVPS